jgi:hypothetical protein
VSGYEGKPKAEKAFNLADYNTVAERIAEFRTKHPEGSLQSEITDLPPAFAEHFIAVKAFAYRTPDDSRPGIGLAWEPVEGKTSFTRDSELQNAETAAWGRAIVAVLAADTKKGIASRDEVQARREDQSTPHLPPERVGRPRGSDRDDLAFRLVNKAAEKGCIIEDGALDGKDIAELRSLWNEVAAGKWEGKRMTARGPQDAPGSTSGLSPLALLPEDLAVVVKEKRGVFAAGWVQEFLQRKGRMVPTPEDLIEIEKECR